MLKRLGSLPARLLSPFPARPHIPIFTATSSTAPFSASFRTLVTTNPFTTYVGAFNLSLSSSVVRLFSAAPNRVLPPAFTDFDYSEKLLRLNDLQDNPGSRKKPKRLGRGPGSHHGGSCGKGMKGTYHRHRLGKRGFEGNQAPLWRVTPKRGRNARSFAKPLNVVNLDRLQMWIDKGRINPGEVITMRVLRDSGLLGNAKVPHGIKLLARGSEKLRSAVHLELTFASEEAKKAVEAKGGSVKFVWFAKIPLRAHLRPHKFPIAPRSNGIPPYKYYRRYGLALEAKPRIQEVVA